MKKSGEQNSGLASVVFLILACASLVAGPVSAAMGSGGVPGRVASARFSGGKLVLVCSRGVEMTVPDGTYKSTRGGSLSFTGGRPVSATNTASKARTEIVSARIDGSGKLVLKSGEVEWSIPDGDFETQRRQAANIDLQNKVLGFKTRGGKIVEVTYSKEGHEAR